MKKIILENSSETLTEAEYQNIITEYNLKLPNSYKEFILKNNGGYPNLELYESENEEFILDSFYALKRGYELMSDEVMSSLFAINSHQELENNIPNYLYPFANNINNHNFCLSMREEDFGSVYITYLDTRKNNITLVSNSFSEFINGLKELDEDDY